MDKIRISTKKKVLTIEMTERQADRCFEELCQGLLSALREDELTSAPTGHATIFEDPVRGWTVEKDDADQSGGVNVKQGKPDGYKGFLYLRCERCGEEHAFNVKTPINDYVCGKCGGVTMLQNLHRAYFHCECGREWKYHTNIDARLLETTCINCNSPMVAEQDKNGDYWPLR